jgi:hypothetical protein
MPTHTQASPGGDPHRIERVLTRMKLIEIFLPLTDNKGRKLRKDLYADTRRELIERFGGLTAYSRSPARGFWKEKGHTTRDEIVVFEVMTKRLERRWWRDYRRVLEKRFKQEEIVIRVFDCGTI